MHERANSDYKWRSSASTHSNISRQPRFEQDSLSVPLILAGCLVLGRYPRPEAACNLVVDHYLRDLLRKRQGASHRRTLVKTSVYEPQDPSGSSSRPDCNSNLETTIFAKQVVGFLELLPDGCAHTTPFTLKGLVSNLSFSCSLSRTLDIIRLTVALLMRSLWRPRSDSSRLRGSGGGFLPAVCPRTWPCHHLGDRWLWHPPTQPSSFPELLRRNSRVPDAQSAFLILLGRNLKSVMVRRSSPYP